MNNADEREAERTQHQNILKKFDSEAPERKDGTIRDEELADKVAAKNDAKDLLAQIAKEEQSRNVKPKDVHTELLVSEDGELNF